MQTARILPVIILSLLLAVTSGQAGSVTGTAFVVSEDGDLVTNEHVVSGCTTVTVRRGKLQQIGRVLGSDASVDLAIVRLSPTPSQIKASEIATLRQSPPLRVGHQAIAYGFPLSGALASDGNLTIGNVSALRGLGDDLNYIQITTPVQPGNSGGPLLDNSGNVIGVVAAKLDALMIMKAIGDVPQNINFAIELGTLKRFLQGHDVRAKEQPSKDDLPAADMSYRRILVTCGVRRQLFETAI
jgi:S1-C subfamily serine protease